MGKSVPYFACLKQSKIILRLDRLLTKPFWIHKCIVLRYVDDITSNSTTAFVTRNSVHQPDQIRKILEIDDHIFNAICNIIFLILKQAT